ncbi:MAG TPA: GyrI-like domain-containing protein [Bacteroidales bacterium]|nr:GyrI-like domain-containing protein [Bacteroidales bacterium]
MTPQITEIPKKIIVGNRLTMSISANRTRELWQSFMPRRNEIPNRVSSDLFSLQLYDPQYFNPFNPDTLFEKWAGVEVPDLTGVPVGMETLTIPAGRYAVFVYKGPASDSPQIFGYIFGTWLPASGYLLDDRPHFEILGNKYKNEGPYSEEEIWIPVTRQPSPDGQYL